MTTLFNPLASVFEWFLTIRSLMPLALLRLIDLSFGFLLISLVVNILWKSKS